MIRLAGCRAYGAAAHKLGQALYLHHLYVGLLLFLNAINRWCMHRHHSFLAEHRLEHLSPVSDLMLLIVWTRSQCQKFIFDGFQSTCEHLDACAQGVCHMQVQVSVHVFVLLDRGQRRLSNG